MAESTIVNYDELAKLAKTFQQEGEIVGVIETQLRQRAQELESEWIGEGAEKFFNEFFQEILPALKRLSQACVLTSQTMHVVANIFNEAEEETAGYFKDGSLEGSGDRGSMGGQGIDVTGLEFNPAGMGPSVDGTGTGSPELNTSPGAPGLTDMPPTGGGEEAGFKVEEGVKPVPASEQPAEKFFNEPGATTPASSMGSGGGGGGSSAGSQGASGGLEMGVGGHSQTSSGPGAAEVSGVGSGGAGMQDHVYQTPAGAATASDASPQAAPQASGPSSAATAQPTGLGEAAGAAGAIGGAGAAASGGAAAAKKLKEKKDNE